MAKFIKCKCCNFVYFPMNEHTKTHCPKCQPQDRYLDDEEYLRSELKGTEEVSAEMIDFAEPKLVA